MTCVKKVISQCAVYTHVPRLADEAGDPTSHNLSVLFTLYL